MSEKKMKFDEVMTHDKETGWARCMNAECRKPIDGDGILVNPSSVKTTVILCEPRFEKFGKTERAKT